MILRRITALVLALVLMIPLAACAGTAEKKPDDGRISIVTTIFPQYDFARAIGGGHADVTMLLAPGEEVHSFEPSPQDIIAIGECDLFIYVGGASDAWVEDVLASVKNDGMSVISLMDCVTVYEEELAEGMQAEEGEDEGVEYDEHVWTSPKNAQLICERICQTLCALDEAGANDYRQSADEYIARLESLDARFRDITANAKRSTVVFADRFPARYFAEEYGLDYYAAFPGCAAETEASAATVAFLIDKVEQESIPVVFTIEFSNGLMAATICEQTGARALEFHSCHNVTRDEFDGGETYLSIMGRNADNLMEALG